MHIESPSSLSIFPLGSKPSSDYKDQHDYICLDASVVLPDPLFFPRFPFLRLYFSLDCEFASFLG